MLVSIYHVTGDDHLDDPAWGSAPIWQGDIGEVDQQLAASKIPLEQLVVGFPDHVTRWAKDFLARRRG